MMHNKDIILKFLKFYKPYISKVVKAALLMITVSLLQLPLPLLTMYIIDNVLVKKDYHLLTILCVLLLFIGLLSLVAGFLQGYYLQYIRLRVMSDIRNRLFNHIIRSNISFFKKHQTGDLMARVLNDISASEGLFADTIVNLLRNSATLIFGVIVIFTINWRLAILSLLSLPFFISSILFFGGKIKKMSKESQQRYSEVSLSLNESLQAPEVIKGFLRENREKLKFFSRINRLVKQRIKTIMLSMTASNLTSLVGMLAPLTVLWYGGQQVMDGHLTLGGFVAFNSFLMYLFNPIQSLIGLNLSIQSSLGAAERIFELLDKKTEDYDRGQHIDILQNKISVHRLFFSYDVKTNVLNDINFDIHAGEKIAIIGASGSGKSTLANLLLRFYEVKQGKILVDGKDLQDLSLKCIREQIGIVHQDTFLFSGTILENISYGKREMGHAHIIEAAKTANMHDYIMNLPAGYHTEVGERGLQLSGGERQRIALARMFLKAPPVIILDESMSQLDYENEKQILENLFSSYADKTIIIITHRPNLIEYFDRVLLLDKGQLTTIEEKKDILLSLKNNTLFDAKEMFYGKKEPFAESQVIY